MKEQIHGGDIYRNKNVIDFSVNSNPLGPQPEVLEAVKEAAAEITHYPDIQYQELRRAISRFEKVKEQEIICGNGAAELFFAVVTALMPGSALIPAPTFAEYEKALRISHATVQYYGLKEEKEFDIEDDILEQITPELDLIFLCNPNNPTGRPIQNALLERILEQCLKCNVTVVLDECFIDFLEDASAYEMCKEREKYPNLLIVKAFTKVFAMPGLRLGYGISTNTRLLERIEEVLQPWNISIPAQAAGVAALENCSTYIERTKRYVAKEREYMKKELQRLGYTVFDSKANYVFFRGRDGLYEKALEAGFLIRDCKNYPGLSAGYYRIAVRTRSENERMIAWLEKL